MTRENQDFDFSAASPPVMAAAPPIVPTTLRATSKGRPVSGEGDLGGAARTIDRVARADCSVLITGDRSPALDNVARALHDRSMRGESPFIAVDCALVPAQRLEEEIFGRAGHLGEARVGAVSAAESGTLFLAYVNELSPSLQTRLLRLVREREYSPVGDVRILKADVRIIAATSRDLELEIAAGRFREELYTHLAVIQVHLPVTPFTMNDAPPSSGIRPILPEDGIDLRAAVEEFESDLILQALRKTGGNKNKAAQLLRVNRTTLVEMVKRKRLNIAG
ncbi:MAG: sigma 54-interacting transcriptional regulator [Byssovorax sp.]